MQCRGDRCRRLLRDVVPDVGQQAMFVSTREVTAILAGPGPLTPSAPLSSTFVHDGSDRDGRLLRYLILKAVGTAGLPQRAQSGAGRNES